MAKGVGTPPNSKTAGPVIIFLLGIVLIFFALIEKCGMSWSQVVYLPGENEDCFEVELVGRNR